MIKVWWVVWHFVHYGGPTDSGLPSWYDSSLKRGRLHWYLVFNRRYREDCRDTFERIFASVFDKQIPQSISRKKRVEKRFREIDDAIDKAIELGYLLPSVKGANKASDDILLAINYKGRELLNPIFFMEACAKEFGYTASIITAFIFGGGLTYLYALMNGLLK